MTDNAEFKPDALDADGDGIVQEGTPFERPAEVTPEELVEDLAAKVEELEKQVEESASVVEAKEEVNDNVISSSTKKGARKPAVAPIKDGIIGSGSVDAKEKAPAKPAAKKEDDDKVVVFSERNVNWQGVGKVLRGYNFVTKEQADSWVTRDHIRLLSPEEVAKELGK